MSHAKRTFVFICLFIFAAHCLCFAADSRQSLKFTPTSGHSNIPYSLPTGFVAVNKTQMSVPTQPASQATGQNSLQNGRLTGTSTAKFTAVNTVPATLAATGSNISATSAAVIPFVPSTTVNAFKADAPRQSQAVALNDLSSYSADKISAFTLPTGAQSTSDPETPAIPDVRGSGQAQYCVTTCSGTVYCTR